MRGYSDDFLKSLLRSKNSRLYFKDTRRRMSLLGWRAEYRWHVSALVRVGGLKVTLDGIDGGFLDWAASYAPSNEDKQWLMNFTESQRDWGRDFNILLTLACPLECEHCSVESSPRRRESLEASDLTRLVEVMKDFRATRPVVRFVLTGGEPFLHRQAMAVLLEAAENDRLLLAVETSGFWAVTMDAARRFVKRYSAIGSYLISADAYHLPYASLNSAINAWKAATEAGKEAKIRVVLPGQAAGQDETLIAELRHIVGESNLVLEKLSPIGRAAKQLDPTSFTGTDLVPALPCPTEGPLVRETGRVDPCCNSLSTLETHPLVLGNLSRDSAGDIDERYEQNALLHCLRLWGIPGLIWLISESKFRGLVPKEFHLNDTCHACYALFKNRELACALEERANTFRVRFEVALGRALLLNENRMIESLEDEFGTQQSSRVRVTA